MVPIALPQRELASLAKRWRIAELALFGSAIREDFGAESDLDFLVTFEPDAAWSLWDFVELKEELETLLDRRVDLVEKRALRNPYRRRHILATAKVVYAA